MRKTKATASTWWTALMAAGLTLSSACSSTSQANPPRPHTPTPVTASTAPETAEVIQLRGGPPAGLTKLQAPVWNYRVKARYPHDPTAFTQGLLVGPDGDLYEGTGLKGRSELRRVELKSGQVKQSTKLKDQYFGEGLALMGDRLVQLTWQDGVAMVYAFGSLKPGPQWHYEGEGWGLTSYKEQFLLSNGSETLSWRDGKDFHEVSKFKVHDGDQVVPLLNELEWVEGEIFANVWQSDYIAVIEPKDGKVKGWIDLRGLLSPLQAQQADVMNGIAYDSTRHHLYVTGKLWPTLFEIEVVRQ